MSRKTTLEVYAAVILSVCSVSAAVAAQPIDGQPSDSLHMIVAVNDLNITTAAGYAEALQRTSAAARRLCKWFGNTSRVDDRESTADCIRAAIADSTSQLQQMRAAKLSDPMS